MPSNKLLTERKVALVPIFRDPVAIGSIATFVSTRRHFDRLGWTLVDGTLDWTGGAGARGSRTFQRVVMAMLNFS